MVDLVMEFNEMSDKFIASIVIPTYNRKEKICSLLVKLARQVTSDIELVVVVDGSIDGTAQEIKKLDLGIENFVLIEQENKGRAGSRNSGAAATNGPIIIFFDDDIIPIPTLVQGHLDEQKVNDIVVGALKSHDVHGNPEMLAFSEYLNEKWTADIDNNVAPYITANNFSIKSKIFRSLGGFDGRLNDSEDLDLAIRLKERGFKIVYPKELIAYLPLNATFSETFSRLKEYKKGREILDTVNTSAKNHVPVVGTSNPMKRFFFFFFSFPFLYKLADRRFFVFMPKSWRMKLYDWMMTGNMIY